MRYQVRNSGHCNMCGAAKLLWEKSLSTCNTTSRIGQMDCYIPGEVTQHRRTYSPVSEHMYPIFCDPYVIFECSRREKKKFDRSQRRKWQNCSARIYFYAWNRPIPLRERKLACAFDVTQVLSHRGADRGIQTRQTKVRPILRFWV